MPYAPLKELAASVKNSIVSAKFDEETCVSVEQLKTVDVDGGQTLLEGLKPQRFVLKDFSDEQCTVLLKYLHRFCICYGNDLLQLYNGFLMEQLATKDFHLQMAVKAACVYLMNTSSSFLQQIIKRYYSSQENLVVEIMLDYAYDFPFSFFTALSQFVSHPNLRALSLRIISAIINRKMPDLRSLVNSPVLTFILQNAMKSSDIGTVSRCTTLVVTILPYIVSGMTNARLSFLYDLFKRLVTWNVPGFDGDSVSTDASSKPSVSRHTQPPSDMFDCSRRLLWGLYGLYPQAILALLRKDFSKPGSDHFQQLVSPLLIPLRLHTLLIRPDVSDPVKAGLRWEKLPLASRIKEMTDPIPPSSCRTRPRSRSVDTDVKQRINSCECEPETFLDISAKIEPLSALEMGVKDPETAQAVIEGMSDGPAKKLLLHYRNAALNLRRHAISADNSLIFERQLNHGWYIKWSEQCRETAHAKSVAAVIPSLEEDLIVVGKMLDVHKENMEREKKALLDELNGYKSLEAELYKRLKTVEQERSELEDERDTLKVEIEKLTPATQTDVVADDLQSVFNVKPNSDQLDEVTASIQQHFHSFMDVSHRNSIHSNELIKRNLERISVLSNLADDLHAQLRDRDRRYEAAIHTAEDLKERLDLTLKEKDEALALYADLKGRVDHATHVHATEMTAVEEHCQNLRNMVSSLNRKIMGLEANMERVTVQVFNASMKNKPHHSTQPVADRESQRMARDRVSSRESSTTAPIEIPTKRS